VFSTASSTIRSDGIADRSLTSTNVSTGASITSSFGSSGTGNLAFGALTLGGQNIAVNNVQTTFSGVTGTALTKSGTGALLILGNKASTGTTTVNAGTVGVTGSFASGYISLVGGVIALSDTGLGASFTRPLSNTGTANVGWSDTGGFAAFGASSTWGNSANNLTVNIGSGASLTWASTANFVADTKTLILGSVASNGTVTFQNSINLNGSSTRTVQVDKGGTNLAGGTDAVLSGVISGTGSTLSRTGSGTLALTNANSYDGGTNVSSGTLLANTSATGTNSATGAGNVSVAGTLGGSGQIRPGSTNGVTVSSTGTLAPGGANSTAIGTLTLKGDGTTGALLTMSAGAKFRIDLGTPNASIGSITANSSDLLVISNAAANDVALSNNVVQFSIGVGQDGFYKLIDTDLTSGTYSGLTFDGTTGVVSAGLTSNLGSFATFIVGTGSNGVGAGNVGDLYVQVTPEPASLPLLGLAMYGLLARRRRSLW
jgi:autotransporter-associated beta strand protein